MPKLTRRTCLTATALGAAGLPTGLPMGTIGTPACAAAPLAAPALVQREPAVADRPLFGAVTWQLANGLTVVLAEQRRAPVVAHYLFYAAGGGEDPAGRSGTAHFLEHMMFKGSPHVAPGTFSLIVAREGGQDNAFTSRDVTAYHQHVEASRLPLVMRLESDRFGHPLLPPETLEPERQVILEERRQRIDANPRGRFWEALEAALWGRQHWHGRPLIGWEEEIRAITRDDLVDFHLHRYAPANAVLVVGGDAREAELRQLAEELYGAVPARTPLRRNRAAPPAEAAQPRLEVKSPALREASIARQIIAPGLLAGESRHAYPLEVLAHLLGSGPGSRLNRALVQSGLATSVGVSYSGDVPSFTVFTLVATARQGIEPARLEAVLDAEIARLLDQGVTEEEVQRSTRQLTAGAVLALDSVGAAPRMLGDALASGLQLDAVEFWPRHIRAVTAAQVTEAARAVLIGSPTTTGWHLPA
jgi:zinc protease